MAKVLIGNEEKEFDVVIYVDVTGDDVTGDGSKNKPYRHIDKAFSALPNTGKACIYALSKGDYELRNGIQGGLHPSIELTYAAHPLHLGKVNFHLYKISYNDRIKMGFLNEFIGIVFKAMSSLLSQYYERFEADVTLNLRFSNCVFDDQSFGASFPIIIFNPSQNTVINCFEFVNCIFKQKSSWSTERFRGLVEFDLSKLPKEKELKRAKLKLYCGYLDSPINLSLFEILDDWREHDVTWSNQPPQGRKIAEKYITHADGYIEIDVFTLVKEWYEGKTPNHGVFLFAEEQNEQSTIQLQTKESSTPPILEVGFYKLISSLALGKLPATLSIRANGEDILTASINVNSKYKAKDLAAQLSIFKKSVDTELSCSMDVVGKRSNAMSAFMSIEKKSRDSIIPAELTVRRLEDTSLLSSITIEKKSRMSQLDASLTVRIVKHQGLFSNLSIEKKARNKQLRSNINVAYVKNLPATLSIEKKERSRDLTCSLIVRQRESDTLSGSVVIPLRKFFASQMFVQHVRDFPCSIQVNSGFLNAEIKVRGYRDVQIPATVTVRVRRISDIHARITVRNLQYDADAGYVFIL